MNGLIAAIDARLNPVWVKEVRQALRGRLFRFGYIVTLLVAGLASVVAAGGTEDRVGRALFLVGFGGLSVALLGLVPFTAFFATPSEREARSLDLILLSGLSPGQIARGRLMSAATQSALYFFAFLPFVSLAAVLPGVDLLAGLVALLGLGVWSLALAAFSIGMGLLLKHRLVRVLVALWMSGTLLYVVSGATFAAAALLERPEALLDADAPFVLLALFGPAIVLLVYGLGASSAMLAHPEENRSTPLRLATLAVAVAGAVCLVLASEYGSPEAVAPAGSLLIAFLGVPMGVFLCEPGRLGRRVQATLPRPGLTALISPLLPGGDRAALFALGLMGGLGAFVYGMIQHYAVSQPEQSVLLLAETLAYGSIYLFLPPLLLGPWTDRPVVRWAATLAIPGLCMGGVFGPMLIGVLFDDGDLKSGRHALNPFWMLDHLRYTQEINSSLQLIFLFAALLAAAQLVRGLSGLRDAVTAAEARRRDEA